MNKKIFSFNAVLYALAVLGIIGGVAMIIYDLKPKPVAQPIMQPSFAPYKDFIAGSGIIEADCHNINVGSMLSGVVDEVLVNAGDKVVKGQPLITLDQRQALSELQIKMAALEVAKSNVEQSKATLRNTQDLFKLVEDLKDTRAISKEEFITRRNNVMIAKTELKSAEANVISAAADLESSKTNLDLLTIQAPIDGNILQVNVDPGQFIGGGQTNEGVNSSSAPILLGGVNTYKVRVDIDETDAWRFKPNTNAIAYLRGNTALKVPLKYEYYEPYVIPKQNLTGESTERVDVRVLQVVYSYDPKDLPSYLGQQVDVYIEVPA
jgi:HlyD family secretion protein